MGEGKLSIFADDSTNCRQILMKLRGGISHYQQTVRFWGWFGSRSSSVIFKMKSLSFQRHSANRKNFAWVMALMEVCALQCSFFRSDSTARLWKVSMTVAHRSTSLLVRIITFISRQWFGDLSFCRNLWRFVSKKLWWFCRFVEICRETVICRDHFTTVMGYIISGGARVNPDGGGSVPRQGG